ncbi:MAG TPA: NUDIX domain-containing protein [Solirubrobacteraceae bacterium]|nr:NUDIX domain-containing protein [Solirubrobacteraceae bacterium]
MAATEREFSAGGVVVRDGEVAVIVPTRRDRQGRKVLALPKGHPEAGESGADAAAREIREETGIEARLVDKLGDVRYFYQRGGRRIAKVVSFFLFEYAGGDVADHDFEVEAVHWMPFEQAERKLTYRGERDVVALAKVHPACRS